MRAAAEDARSAGACVISLDFELHWGVRDHVSTADPYCKALRGARKAIPKLLHLFEEREMAATWATVGFLFASDKAELDSFSPSVRPTYDDSRLDPYGEPVGDDEDSDPLHYGRTLLRLIHRTPRQEIATHTFSHYYCLEPSQTAAQFAADVGSAIDIARSVDVPVHSIVFPRNQHNPAYDRVLTEHHIRCYRGNPRSRVYRPSSSSQNRLLFRLGRLLDAYLPLTGSQTTRWDDVVQPSGLADVRASFFLRPFNPRLKHLDGARLRRLSSSLRTAAAEGAIFHLWWHPHNFGLHTENNLAFLASVLDVFAECRDKYGMRSMTMADAAEQALHKHAGASD